MQKRRFRRTAIYAIVRSGGKQYRVEPEQVIEVDRLAADVGATVELTDVLLVAGDGDVRIGRPTVEGARVLADVLEHGRGEKIIVFKYKAKTRYRRRQGHRQNFTRLAIRQILPEAGAAVEAKPKRPRRAAKAQAADAAELAAAEAPKRPRAARAKASAAAKPKPRRKRTESEQ